QLLGCGMEYDAWSSLQIALRAGHREMHRLGNHITQVEQIERAVMRNHSAIFPGCKPGGHDLLPREGGIVSQAVETATDPEKSAAARMMGKQVPIKPTGPSLL